MTANALYRNLSTEPWWATQRKIVRWVAARYYAGVETADQLLLRTQPRPVTGDFFMPPELTEAEVAEIIRLR